MALFLKRLHPTQSDFGGESLKEELIQYRNYFDECEGFYSKHFTIEEHKALRYLMHEFLPSVRENLGEKLVLCHADLWEPNILLDENGTVGIIDCSNAGYFDEAADFMVEDAVLRKCILDSYGAGDSLRKKVEVKYDMSVLAGPKFGITLWGEDYVLEKWAPEIRGIILKYKKC
jgi:hypothetical protein